MKYSKDHPRLSRSRRGYSYIHAWRQNADQKPSGSMQMPRIVVRCELVATTLKPATRTFPQHSALATIARGQQSRHSSFLHNDQSTPSSSRKSQKGARESWFARRKKERSARKKISTLALDHNLKVESDKDASREHAQSDQQGRKGQDTGSLMTRRQRRLLLWTAVLTMPLWGRDIVETVVPGMLGVFILVAGKIKRAINWARSPSRADKR